MLRQFLFHPALLKGTSMGRAIAVLVSILGVLVALDRLRSGGDSETTEPSVAQEVQPEEPDPAVLRPQAASVALQSVPPGTGSRGGAALARLEVRRRVAEAGPTAYLDSAVAGDSILRRWVGREGAPLRIALRTDGLPGVTAGHLDRFREAIAQWEGLRLGLRFVVLDDAADAEIVVSWIERFTTDRSGLTVLQAGADGQIRRAEVTLALETVAGIPLPPSAQLAISLHEMGHAIGMPHSGDQNDVMYPTTRATKLTRRDQTTAELLYRLPPGSVVQ